MQKRGPSLTVLSFDRSLRSNGGFGGAAASHEPHEHGHSGADKGTPAPAAQTHQQDHQNQHGQDELEVDLEPGGHPQAGALVGFRQILVKAPAPLRYAEEQINQKLHQSAILELKFQYSLWKKDYKSAYEYANNIVQNLNAPALNGYKCFWNYMTGCMAYYLFKDGQAEYKTSGIQCLSDAVKENMGIRWLPGLSEKLFFAKSEDVKDTDFFVDCIEKIESIFTLLPTLQKTEKKIESILRDLNSSNGNEFERGHKGLGELLGFISENPNSTGAPDPYWIINENNLVVSEDKIYEEKEQVKKVPISDVSEAGRHKAWIVEHEKRITKGANVYTILITNSDGIDDEARIYADDIYYVNRKEYVDWAVKALTVIRSVWNTFSGEGESEWREAVHKEFIIAGITPKDYLNFVCNKKLKDI